MAAFESIVAPSRADLEKEAIAFFARLAAEVSDVPRRLDLDNFHDEHSFNVEETRRRIAELDAQLAAGDFDGVVQRRASELATSAGSDLQLLSESDSDLVYRLAARAEREQMVLLLHQLMTPAKRYRHFDELFDKQGNDHSRAQPSNSAGSPQISLHDLGELFLVRKAAQGIKAQKLDEIARPIQWLQERLNPDRAAESVTRNEFRQFRTDLTRLSVAWRGRLLSFDQRLTNVADDTIKSVTSSRYWNTIVALFRWAVAEGHVRENHADGLVVDKKAGEAVDTPDPFSTAELTFLLQTPLYAGYKPPNRWSTPGECHRRYGQWWSGVLLLYTGLRAGELAQLLPEDFDFAAEIPHLKVREENGSGEKIKSTKNESSKRDVPLAKALLDLGLAEFVHSRPKAKEDRRVFHALRLGVNRSSDGLSKFWGPYLKRIGLWKKGRATHVFRHTVAATLRANGVSDEDIGAFLGHRPNTITAGYGGPQPLSRKRDTLTKLNFGIDLVEALGGVYDKSRHG